MNKKFIVLSITSCIITGVSMFFLSKILSEKKINKKIKSMGNLNVTIDDKNPELFLELNKDSLDNIEHTKYAIFNVRLLSNKKN